MGAIQHDSPGGLGGGFLFMTATANAINAAAIGALFSPSLRWFVRFFFILDDTDLSIAFDIDQLHF